MRNSFVEDVYPEPKQKIVVLTNAYILEVFEDGLLVLYDGMELKLKGKLDLSYDYKYLADITVSDDFITDVRLKNSIIKGRVMAVYNDRIEVDGFGTLPLSSDFCMYEDYEKPCEVSLDRLVVGSESVEFIAAEGMICAGIIKAPPDLTTIRVAIHTTDYKGLFHEKLQFLSHGDILIQNSDSEQRMTAGEMISFSVDDLKINERIILVPADEVGIEAISVVRSQGNPIYGGVLEIIRREEGLLLINEIGLEEYLCSVVPSEMPSSYHIEALKAQAVCARSYARNQMQEGRLREYSAHVDDSVGYQVYNNLARQERTTEAVYATAGEVAVHDDSVINAYYFSTSSGTTTTGEIWKNGKDIPYLISKDIIDPKGTAYESEEPWYRWSVFFDGKDYWNGVVDRAETVLNSGDIGVLKELMPGRRISGDVLNSIMLLGSKKTVTIETEYAVRKVLCESGRDILRNDGSVVKSGSLLPSAFIEFDITYKDGNPDRITIDGGGYGHGAGMSQNGANKMAEDGMTYKEILQFFYEDVTIENR